MKTRAIVIGGSLGGLFAANLLQDLGWEVDVFERVGDDLASRGAGIGTHDELLAVLGRLGIEIDDRFGVRVAERICLDPAGNPIYRLAWGHMMSAWARIYRPLKDRLPRRTIIPAETSLTSQGTVEKSSRTSTTARRLAPTC